MINRNSCRDNQPIRRIALTLVLLVLVFIGGCTKNESKTQAQIVEGYMTKKPWSINTVSVDGVDKTSSFAGMELSFTPTSFSTTNSNAIWPSNGAWSFTDATGSAFKINDQLEVTIVQASTNSLTFSLTWTKTTYAGGRAESISGGYEFQFR